mmetsp:Transcript_102310/g.328093  ORF Transcript_102310/g.328093 Transcript_102310/m.328093 type:complete len:479 (+) Transcript_102310:61-1497(+)
MSIRASSWLVCFLLLVTLALGLAGAPLSEQLLDAVHRGPQLPSTFELLRFTADLDAPPGERFVPIWKAFLEKRGHGAFQATYKTWHTWEQLALPELFGNSSTQKATQAAWLEALRVAHPGAFAELTALSKTLQQSATTGGDTPEPLFELPALASLISIYPLTLIAEKNGTDTIPSACTSTLVRRADGSLLHGRSLDYEPRDPMAEGTVAIEFQRRGRLEYRCLYTLPYVTAFQWFTCVRPGAFSLSVNARGQGIQTEHNTSFSELLRRVQVPGALLLGEVAELAMQASSFEGALAVLTTSRVVSSNYFILAGADKCGAIVTRFGNSSSADVWAIGDPSDDKIEDGQPSWMRVQTNVDHWVPFSSGAYATHRRQGAIDLLADRGQQAMGEQALLDVYFTTHARAGSQNRTTPEDTGVILRPSTIATLVMDPTSKDLASATTSWHVWKTSPNILPPQPVLAPATAAVSSESFGRAVPIVV